MQSISGSFEKSNKVAKDPFWTEENWLIKKNDSFINFSNQFNRFSI